MKISSKNPLVLVDDDDVDALFLKRCLELSQLSNKLVYFSTGQAFLTHMDKVGSGDAAIPAMVLLDINMCPMDGFHVAEQLRQREEFRTSPMIIFYSNSDNPRDIERAESLSASFKEKFYSRRDAVTFLNSLA